MIKITQPFYLIFDKITGIITFCDSDNIDLLKVLFIFIAAEFIINILYNIVYKSAVKKTWKKWICNRIIVLIVIFLVNIIENYIIGSNGNLQAFVIIFYISREGLLILYTIKNKFNIPIPDLLQKSFYDIYNKFNNK